MLSRVLLPVGIVISTASMAVVGLLLALSGVLPAGEQMSFTFARGWRSGPFSVYLLDVSRHLSHRLVQSYSIGNPGLPVTWSPDGEQLAYSEYYHFERHETFVYNLTQRQSESLLNGQDIDEPGNAYNAVWSPDGNRIAYTGGVRGEDIFIVSPHCLPQACLPRNLTEYGEGYAYLAWSPDNRSLAYVNILGGSDIYVSDVETGQRRNLSRHSGRDVLPVWSPDGAQIAFLSTLGGTWYDVYVMNRDGSNIRRMTTGNPLQSAWRLWWSPDGQYLLYTVNSWGGGNDVYVIDVAREGTYHITRDEFRDGSASWSPDGARILYESRAGSHWNLFVVERDCVLTQSHCDPLRLTNDSHDSRRPVWSPDGTRVAYMANPSQTWRGWDIFVIAADGTSKPERLTSGNGREIRFGPLWRPSKVEG